MFPRLLRVSAVIFIFLIAGAVLAQPATLTYGSGVTDKIDAATPQGFFNFSGATGDLVTVYIVSHTPGFSPTISLLGPTGQQIGYGSQDVFTPVNADASITYRLQQDGFYTILVGSLTGAPGTYTIVLDAAEPAVSTVLDTGLETRINIPPGAAAIHYSIPADNTVTLTVQGVEGFPFTALVRDYNGRPIAVVGSGVVRASFELPAADGPYMLEVAAAAPELTGDVVINTGGPSTTVSQPSAPQPSDSGAPPPATTEEAAAPPPSDVCTASASAGPVNMRSGPGTDYAIVSSLPQGQYIIVTGQNSGWYYGQYGGQNGWVAGSVTVLNGPCSAVPFREAPPTTGVPQPTATYTYTPGGPTPTYTPTTDSQQTGPTATPPSEQPTATATLQTAPPDGNHTWDVDRNNGGTFSDAVSYPEGDTSDRITVRVNLGQLAPNNDRNISFTITCSGTGTQYLTFHRSSPNAQAYTCGQSITWRFTHPFGTQDFYVVLSNGPAYVSYTITATILP